MSFVSKNLHPSCVVYEGLCSRGKKYMGETDRGIHLRTDEHEKLKKDSEPAKFKPALNDQHKS